MWPTSIPKRSRSSKQLFWQEAERNQVLAAWTPPPSPARSCHGRTSRPVAPCSPTAGEVTGTPNGNAPNVLASSYNIKAEVEIPEGGAEGMLVTHGGRFTGYGFYLLEGKPVYTWNL